MSSLKDKVILITGSGDVTGIGALTAKYLVQFQPKLVLTGRDSTRLEKVGEMCREVGLPQEMMLLATADLNTDGDIDRLVTLTIQTFNQLDVLINNASVLGAGSILDVPMENFDHVIKTNLRAPVYLARLCIPHLAKTKGYKKLLYAVCMHMNCMSVKAVCAIKGLPKINIRQFQGYVGLLKWKYSEYIKFERNKTEFAKDGIRVNSVNPGAVNTNIFIKGGLCSEEQAEQAFKQQAQLHPLQRIATPEDIAKAITFLASDDASYITGEFMSVDGGRQHCINTK